MSIDDLRGGPDPKTIAKELDIPEMRSEEHMAHGDTVTATNFDPLEKKPKTVVVIDRGVPTHRTSDNESGS